MQVPRRSRQRMGHPWYPWGLLPLSMTSMLDSRRAPASTTNKGRLLVICSVGRNQDFPVPTIQVSQTFRSSASTVPLHLWDPHPPPPGQLGVDRTVQPLSQLSIRRLIWRVLGGQDRLIRRHLHIPSVRQGYHLEAAILSTTGTNPNFRLGLWAVAAQKAALPELVRTISFPHARPLLTGHRLTSFPPSFSAQSIQQPPPVMGGGADSQRHFHTIKLSVEPGQTTTSQAAAQGPRAAPWETLASNSASAQTYASIQGHQGAPPPSMGATTGPVVSSADGHQPADARVCPPGADERAGRESGETAFRASQVAAVNSRLGDSNPSRYPPQHKLDSQPSYASPLTSPFVETRPPPGGPHAHSGRNITGYVAASPLPLNEYILPHPSIWWLTQSYSATFTD
jgi:hypothetical protein